MIIDWNQGDYVAIPGSSDYPVESDVLLGISYGFGLYVGNAAPTLATTGIDAMQLFLDTRERQLND